MNAEMSTTAAELTAFQRLLLSDAARLAPGIASELLGGFGVSLILGIYMPPAALGLFMLLWLAQSYASALTTGWIRSAVIRFLPEDDASLRGFLRLALLTVAATGLAGLVVAAGLVRLWSDRIEWEQLIWAVAILCGVSLYTIFQGMLRGVFAQWRYSTSAMLLNGLKVLLIVILLPNASNPTTMVLFVMAISYPPVLVWQIHGLYRHPTPGTGGSERSASTLFRPSLTYGLPLALSFLILTVLQSGDRYVLANLMTLQDVGVYAFWMSIALQFGRGMYNLVFIVLNPRLFQLHSVDPTRARGYVRELAGLYTVAFAPLLALVGCIALAVLPLLNIRTDYVDSSHLLFFGLGMAFLLGLTQLCGKNREFDAETKVFVWAALLGVLTMIAGAFVLVPMAGLNGAASATLFGFCAYFGIVAARAHSWPPAADTFTGLAGMSALITIFLLGTEYYSAAIGLLGMAGVAAIYARFASARVWLDKHVAHV